MAEDSVQRVIYYEKLMDEIKDTISSANPTAQKLQMLQPKLGKLRRYYSSLDWMNDFETDEAGMFPAGLKRGVLSEDGVDNLLDGVRDWSTDIVNKLRKKTSVIIDILPASVTENNGGQWPEIKRFFLDDPNIYDIRRRFSDIIIKLNCYYSIIANNNDFSVWSCNPEPETLYGWILNSITDKGVHVIIPEEDTLLEIRHNTTGMSVFNAGSRLMNLIEKLSLAEGLFVCET